MNQEIKDLEKSVELKEQEILLLCDVIASKIVLKAIERFPKLPNRTLARYILMENGEYFDGDIEKIRTSVRWFSGSRGDRSRHNKREIVIPKTLRNKRTPYHLTPGKRKIEK